jgi:antitoxin CptB
MDDVTRLARLRWRCRRGMRELDELLGRFAAADAPFANASQCEAFERLLELPDPLLADWLILGWDPPAELEEIVDRIRAYARAAPA